MVIAVAAPRVVVHVGGEQLDPDTALRAASSDTGVENVKRTAPRLQPRIS
jgi:hypothetical protein